MQEQWVEMEVILYLARLHLLEVAAVKEYQVVALLFLAQ
jgi:hypothetical protein